MASFEIPVTVEFILGNEKSEKSLSDLWQAFEGARLELVEYLANMTVIQKKVAFPAKEPWKPT